MSRTPARNQVAGPFVLNNEAVFPWNVTCFVPSPKGDGKIKVKFGVEFKHVTGERRLELLAEFRQRQRERDARIAESEDAEADVDLLKDGLSFESVLLDEVVVRFTKNVHDAEGNDISAAEGTKEAMLKNAWARSALLAAYNNALEGRSPEGN